MFCLHDSLIIKGDSMENTYYECKKCGGTLNKNNKVLKFKQLVCRHGNITRMHENDGEINLYCKNCGKMINELKEKFMKG